MTAIILIIGTIWLMAVAFFDERSIMARLTWASSQYSKLLRILRGSVWIIGLVWCLLSLSESLETRAAEKHHETLFVLDISYSMLAEDITPNRLERIKKLIENIIAKAPSNERFGIVLFAGKPFVLSYPTGDIPNLLSIVREISTESIHQSNPQYAGTNIGDSLLLAESLLDRTTKNPRILLFTDGEGNKGSEVGSVGGFLKRQWVILTNIGVGSTEGIELITTDRFGNKRQFVENGAPIITRLDSTLLTMLTASASGSFQSVTNNEQMNTLENALMQQSTQRVSPIPPKIDARGLLLIAFSEWIAMLGPFLRYRLWKYS